MAGLVTGIANATVNASTVLILAGLGEVISERAGVLNLGVEGMMLVGALSGFIVTSVTGNYWLGMGVAIDAGGLMALLHAFLCISLNSDQAVSGIMLTLLGTGLTTYFGGRYIGINIDGFATITIPGLSEIPVVGQAFFRVTALDYLSLLLVPVVWYFLFRTNVGAEITAVATVMEAESPSTPCVWMNWM